MTRSAPAASACTGRSGWNARCAPQASSTTSGTPCEWATSTRRSHVGDRAEVGRRGDVRAHRAGRVGERRVERLGGDAVRDAQLRVELGLHEARPQAGHDQPVHGARVRRCAAPRSRRRDGRAPGTRRGCPARRRSGGTRSGARPTPRRPAAAPAATASARARASIPSISAGMSSASALLADRLAQLGVGARAALVARHVEASRPPAGVGAQRVEVGRFRLDQPSLRRTAATASAGVSNRSTPSRSQLSRPDHGLVRSCARRRSRTACPTRRRPRSRRPRRGRRARCGPRPSRSARRRSATGSPRSGRCPGGSRASSRPPRARPSTPPP